MPTEALPADDIQSRRGGIDGDILRSVEGLGDPVCSHSVEALYVLARPPYSLGHSDAIFHHVFAALRWSRYIVAVTWVAIVAACVWPSLHFVSITSSSFAAPSGTRAAVAKAALQAAFPLQTKTQLLTLLVERTQGNVIDEWTRRLVEALTTEILPASSAPAGSVRAVVSYYNGSRSLMLPSVVSGDNRTTLVAVSYLSFPDERTWADSVRSGVAKWVQATPEGASGEFAVEMSGMALLSVDGSISTSKDLKKMETISLPLALLVIVLVLQSAPLMVIPLTSVFFSIAVSYSIMYLFGRYVLDVPSVSPSVMMSLTTAMSFDYSLFILSRYREELSSRRKSEVPLAWFYRPQPVDVDSNTERSASLPQFAVTVCVNLTLTPVLLLLLRPLFSLDGFFPGFNTTKLWRHVRGVFTRATVAPAGEPPPPREFWKTLALAITRVPVAIAILVCVVALCAPVVVATLWLRTTADLTVLVCMKDSTAANESVWSNTFFTQSGACMRRLSAVPGVSNTSVTGVMTIGGSTISFRQAQVLLNPLSAASKTPLGATFRLLAASYVSAGNDSALVVVPTVFDPSDNISGFIDAARAVLDDCTEQGPYVYHLIGALTTELKDSVDKTMELFPTVIGATAAVVFVLLLIAYRTLFMPPRTLLTIALTLGFTFGLGTVFFVFDWFDRFFPTLQEVDSYYWFVPIASFDIILGLALDYDIFLFSRIVEYRRMGATTRVSVVKGVEKTGSIITFAGVIMALAFGGLMSSSNITVMQLGFMLTSTKMKLEMQDMAGRRFYVLKPWHARLSDPDSFHAAKATENGRVYTTTSLRRLESLGAIIRAPPFAHGVVLVAKDASDMLGGRAQGFWKLIQKRLRVKHASSSIDPHLMPELADLGAWLAEIRTGPVEDVPQLRASATLFPWSDEVLVSVKPEKTTTMVSARQKEITEELLKVLGTQRTLRLTAVVEAAAAVASSTHRCPATAAAAAAVSEGISEYAPFCDRDETCSQLVGYMRHRNAVLVRAPPRSGKTALISLLVRYLRKTQPEALAVYQVEDSFWKTVKALFNFDPRRKTKLVLFAAHGGVQRTGFSTLLDTLGNELTIAFLRYHTLVDLMAMTTRVVPDLVVLTPEQRRCIFEVMMGITCVPSSADEGICQQLIRDGVVTLGPAPPDEYGSEAPQGPVLQFASKYIERISAMDSILLDKASRIDAKDATTAGGKKRHIVERAFTMELYRTLCAQLPDDMSPTPERAALDAEGKVIGYLDFWVNSAKKWAIEVLSNGTPTIPDDTWVVVFNENFKVATVFSKQSRDPIHTIQVRGNCGV
eukprot:m51a1_g4397 hypothetical protein (1309) ;mRNA; f:377629-385380